MTNDIIHESFRIWFKCGCFGVVHKAGTSGLSEYSTVCAAVDEWSMMIMFLSYTYVTSKYQM